MAVSETDRSQVCLEAEDLQSDPGQGGVGQEEGTNAVVVRNRDIIVRGVGRVKGRGAGRS